MREYSREIRLTNVMCNVLCESHNSYSKLNIVHTDNIPQQTQCHLNFNALAKFILCNNNNFAWQIIYSHLIITSSEPSLICQTKSVCLRACLTTTFGLKPFFHLHTTPKLDCLPRTRT